MSRKVKKDLENLYEQINKPMTVGTTKPGDLEGKTKEKGPKGAGPENTDAVKATKAPEDLQGDTVESSKKTQKGTSKFDELYAKALKENSGSESIESDSFDSESGDFPPAGEEEAIAELGDEEGADGEQSLADLFADFSDVAAKIAAKYQEEEVGAEPEMISDTTDFEGEEVAEEAVESTPAPDGVAKFTKASSKDVKGVKVSKEPVNAKGSGAKNGGKPETCADTTLGPKTKLKVQGSGAAVEGGNKNLFG